MPRYDFQPLQEATRLSVSEMARRSGMDRALLQNYKRYGFTFLAAEKAAEGLGYVPYEIWPEWLEESNRLSQEALEREMAENAERLERRRAQRQASSQRYRERHPDRVRETNARYRQTSTYRGNVKWWAKLNSERKRELSRASQRRRAAERNARRRERYRNDPAHRAARLASAKDSYQKRVAS